MTQQSFRQSQALLKKTLKTVPLASQTFSKSIVSLPEGVSPYFAEKANGCTLTDIDGNHYTDFINALLCISLGYCDLDVDNAVIEQVKQGSIYSLPHRLEGEVAELLVELIPCAEQVRFGKNGSDATSAAIRLARAHTGHDHIAVCGYHGWQDWYIGSTTRDLGVPEATKTLTHPFAYNDIASLEAIITKQNLAGQPLAAIILEPMNLYYPEDDFLPKIRELCDKHQIVMIFDETITGFRFDIGGAQQLFNVTPDLATFGKGMANGYPISAIVGKQHMMKHMKDIFFSGTFGGDTIALSAAKATINKMKHQNVLTHIHNLGQLLLDGLNDIINTHNLSDYFSTAGHPSWAFLMPKDGKNHDVWTIKTYLMQELIAHGFLSNGSHNLSFAHQASDISALLKVYKKLLPKIKSLDESKQLKDALNCPVMQSVFKVR